MRIKQAINELITAFPRYSLEGIALVTISFLGVFFYLQNKSSSIAILGGIALVLKNYFHPCRLFTDHGQG